MEEESEDEVEQLPGSRRGNYMLCGARVSHGGMASGVKAGVDAASQQRRQARQGRAGPGTEKGGVGVARPTANRAAQPAASVGGRPRAGAGAGAGFLFARLPSRALLA